MLKHIQTISMWKKEMFKWNRADTENDDTYETTGHPLVSLGRVDPTNTHLKHLHWASIHGRKKDILTVLQTGMWVDFPNDAGQTALFCATLRGQYGAVKLLLQNGANPNEKSDTGMTPVHVACLKASLKAIGAMIEAGGDLRLHDNKGNSCLDWAKCNPEPRKRMKMIEFLQKSQLFALNYSGDFIGHANSLDRQPSILQMLRGKVGSQMSLDFGPETGLRRVHSHGFGRVYYGGEAANGMVSVIPLITENQLRKDVDGISFESCSGFTLTSMLWNMTTVTIKKMDMELQKRGSVDLLISEVEHLSKLRHPSILLLMGLCQSSDFDGLMLVFERVSIGSLFHVLHEKTDHLPMTYIRDIAIQVCQALLYVHGQSYIHCGLTSHAVYMVSMHQAKVGNLEYAVEMKKASAGRACLVASSPHKEHLFNWMAPEVMMGDSPGAASDVYSFCCILWEMITSELPWKSKTANEVLELHKSDMAQLSSPSKCVVLFQEIMEQGLKKDPACRPLNFVTLHRWFQGPLDKPPGWRPSALDRFKILQKESKERISVSSGSSSFFNDSDQSFSEELNSSSSFSKDSSSSGTPPDHSVDDKQPNRTPTDTTKETLTRSSEDKSDGRNEADSTNNHHLTTNHSKGSASDSCSTLGNNHDDVEFDSVDNIKTKEATKSGRSLDRRDDKLVLGKVLRITDRAHFERSSSLSAVSRLKGDSCPTAFLPWQGSHEQLRPSSISPRLSRSPRKHQNPSANKDKNARERCSKTLPLVKPASHSTDVKEFIRGDHASDASDKMIDIISGRTKRHLPRRSLPLTRNLSLIKQKSLPRSRSAAGDVIETDEKDVELSMPGSVRTLTEQFQARLYKHSLRQSILKGSMMPQGILFADLDTSPTCLKRSDRLSEASPEGMKQTDVDSPDKEMLTDSTKGSTESLTSVSFRDDSIADEDSAHDLPLSSRNELDITQETAVPRPTPVYPPLYSQLRNNLSTDPSILQETSAFRVVRSSDPEFGYSDCGHRPCIGPEKKQQFLPSSLSGTDVSSHPFDFPDYYIDDDYTGLCGVDSSLAQCARSGDCQTVQAKYRFRRKTRERVWLGDHQRGQLNKRRASQTKGDVDEQESRCFVTQAGPTDSWKGSLARQSKPSKSKSAEYQRVEESSYRKYDEWFANEWDKKDECNGDVQEIESDQELEQIGKTEDGSDGYCVEWPEKKGPKEREVEDQFLHDQSGSREELETGVNNDWPSDWLPEYKTEKQRQRGQERGRGEELQGNPAKLDHRQECSASGEQHSSKFPAQDEYDDENGCNTEHMDGSENPLCDHKQPSYHDQYIHTDVVKTEEDGALTDSQAGSYTSRESSLSTVVERNVTDTWQQPVHNNSDNDDDENDNTLIPDDLADQRRCIVLNLERNVQFQGEACEAEDPTVSSSPPSVRSSPQSTLRKFYLSSSTGCQGYTTTLRVESSLETPGHHRITQTACDTNTGVTQTVHEETVQAETLRTTMGIQ